jgi:hypothetical protein
MSCSCTLVFHARPATIFLGDGAVSSPVKSGGLNGSAQHSLGPSTCRSSHESAQVSGSDGDVRVAQEVHLLGLAQRSQVELAGRGTSYYRWDILSNYRLHGIPLGRQHPKTVLLPAYGNFGICKMDLTLWALQNPTHHRAFSASSFGSGA